MSEEKKLTGQESREQLNQVLDAFLKEQTNEKKAEMINVLVKTRLFVPGKFPDGTDLSQFKPTKPGETKPLPADVKPLPALLKNKEGSLFLPVYTDQTLIPAEMKPQVVMNMPFMALVNMALNEKLHLDGMAVNPHTQNVLIKQKMLQALKEQDQKRRQQKPKTIRVTGEQAKVLLRQKTEFDVIPKALYQDPKAFMDAVVEEGEQYLCNFYAKNFQNPEQCPFKEDAFSTMVLNIREDLQLVRIDLPEEKKPIPVAFRAYVLYDEEQNRADYYTIEYAGKAGEHHMSRFTPNGREDFGEAPVEGAELQRILDIYDDNWKN